jgi:hypothetical protein
MKRQQIPMLCGEGTFVRISITIGRMRTQVGPERHLGNLLHSDIPEADSILREELRTWQSCAVQILYKLWRGNEKMRPLQENVQLVEP